MTNITELFIQSLCICIASVITTAAFMGTAVLVSVIVGFGIDKIREIKKKRGDRK